MTSLLLITLIALTAGTDAEATIATLDGRAISGAIQSWSAKEMRKRPWPGIMWAKSSWSSDSSRER